MLLVFLFLHNYIIHSFIYLSISKRKKVASLKDFWKYGGYSWEMAVRDYNEVMDMMACGV